ncbi:MAG TPA: hypothetical protein ACHBX6_12335 [Arsenophonus nasoniae]|uniref:hypothetical protein n=1 Tax=Arsenophonus nasoniae TaxID=638 RepID=UPI003878FE56
MSYQIVDINVSQTISATPSNLQQKAAFLSYGYTSAQIGIPYLITNIKDYNDITQIQIVSYTAETNSANTETTLYISYPEDVKLPYEKGENIQLIISGCYPEKPWNGAQSGEISEKLSNTIVCKWLGSWDSETSPSILGKFTFTGDYAEGINPYELTEDVRIFFSQGANIGAYILELGPISTTVEELAQEQLKRLIAYVQEPEERIYSYQLTEAISALDETRAFAKQYEAPDAMQYFFVKVKDTNPYKTIKSAPAMTFKRKLTPDTLKDPCPSGAFLWNYVSPSPSEVNKVPPMSFRYLRGVDALKEKDSILQKYDSDFINYVGTGAEGGISNTILLKGVFSDGNDATYWYSVDWVQINVKQALANAIINGSNNPINPLYYNQDGIDRLQIVAQNVMNSGISYGLINPDITGGVTVNAIPFKEYITNNPTDYAIGRYAGLSVEYAPNRGFTKIIFNINVTLQAA